MKDRLDVTVLIASFTEEPTRGTKLLIANLAVLIERVSALCESVFLYDKTNIKIDITNIVTEVNVVLTVFDIPLKSKLLFKDFAQPNAKHILHNGSINTSKKPCTMLINSSIEPFETTAEEILPLIDKSATIIGIKAFITEHKLLMYTVAFLKSILQILNTVIDKQRVEQIETTLPKLLSDIELLIVWKIESSIERGLKIGGVVMLILKQNF